MPKPVDIVYSTSLSPCDPAKSSSLIVGQLGHLKQITFSQLATKLSPNVTEDVSWLYREIVPAGTVQIVPKTIENIPFSMAMGTISRVIYTETYIRVLFFLSQFLILLLIYAYGDYFTSSIYRNQF